MSEQTTVPTVKAATKTTKKKQAEKKAKGAPKRTRKEKKETEEGLVVFAFRLSQAERDAIHKTAGPARASRYVRRVTVAFAAEDVEAFKAVVKEAKEARG